RNIISGNQNAITLNVGTGSPGSFGNVIEGNYIGTDPSGTQVVPHSVGGISFGPGVDDNIIGGTVPGAGNVISGQGDFGIALFGASSNLIQGNLIGTDKTGTVALGNDENNNPIGWSGINIENFGGAVANNNTLGGTTAGAGNTIAFNRGDGVDIDSGTGSSILGNSIFSNAVQGIFLNTA